MSTAAAKQGTTEVGQYLLPVHTHLKFFPVKKCMPVGENFSKSQKKNLSWTQNFPWKTCVFDSIELYR